MASESDQEMAHEPSSQGQLEHTADTGPKVAYADRESFSPEQRRWEGILRDNLGSFYYPLYLAAKERGEETAWDYVEDTDQLPRMLIIGDSISRGVTLPIRHAARGIWNVHRAPENCGRSANARAKLALWLDDQKWDIILFNFGIHDRHTDSDTYAENLNWTCSEIKDTGASLFWFTSTPVPEGADEYVEGAIDRLNLVAADVMHANDIPIIDLHTFIRPQLAAYQLPKNCHYTNPGYEHMAHFLIDAIRHQLAAR